MKGSAMDDEARAVLEIMQPFLRAFTPEQQNEMRLIIEKEASGVFAWAVKSGYLLWSRAHPGEVPPSDLVRQWSQGAPKPKPAT